jgi:hypothetical protein
LGTILNEVHQYHHKGYFLNEFANIKEYFKMKTSPGCLMVEQENGQMNILMISRMIFLTDLIN